MASRTNVRAKHSSKALCCGAFNVGAEPEGLHLIDFAIRDGYAITLIEPDQEKAFRAYGGKGSIEPI
jgi:hypothetical protein